MKTEAAPIQHIIFDLGGVILPIYPERSMMEISMMLKSTHTVQALQPHFQELVRELESGICSGPAFLRQVAEWTQPSVSLDDILLAWNRMLGPPPQENLSLLRKTRARYRTFLLSNTNPLHLAEYTPWFKQDGLDWQDYFEGMVLSFLEGLMKPDTRIYERLLHRYELDAAFALFIDDHPDNVDAARGAGIQAVCLQPGQRLVDLFDAQGALLSLQDQA